jgi:hypothetical protein
MTELANDPSFPPKTTHYLTSATTMRLYTPERFSKKHFSLMCEHMDDYVVNELDSKYVATLLLLL